MIISVKIPITILKASVQKKRTCNGLFFYKKYGKELQEEEKEIVKLWMNWYTYQEINGISNVNTKKVDNTLQRKLKKF